MDSPAFLIIVQARMSSKRLPGKVMRSLNGKPMLEYVLDGCANNTVKAQTVVATSSASEDEAISQFCRIKGIPCLRGPLNRVSQRFVLVLERFRPRAFIRICADSPLILPQLIDRCTRLFLDTGCDIATNTRLRSFPKGESVECVNTDIYLNMAGKIVKPDHQEHVTRYFYDNPQGLNIENFTSGHPWGNLNLSVDTDKDWKRIRALMARLDKPHWQYRLEELIQIGEGPDD